MPACGNRLCATRWLALGVSHVCLSSAAAVLQATLGVGARNGERVGVMIHAGDEEKTSVLLCALRCVAASACTSSLFR
jgi:hypothetical protein